MDSQKINIERFSNLQDTTKEEKEWRARFGTKLNWEFINLEEQLDTIEK